MSIQTDLNEAALCGVLPLLLKDRTTGKNIIWASGEHWADEITPSDVWHIQRRVDKQRSAQNDRKQKRGEVFTPLHIVSQMTDMAARALDQAEPQAFVGKRVLEICCGEAPFLTSRYDAASGKDVPLARRVGLLDQKLQAVSLHAKDEKEWFDQTMRAYENTYGYEFCGDNLFVARLNLWMTFGEYYADRYKRRPPIDQSQRVASIISWNVWQMDGLTDRVPATDGAGERCCVRNWDDNKEITFSQLKAAT